jgi:hypothetical protein
MIRDLSPLARGTPRFLRQGVCANVEAGMDAGAPRAVSGTGKLPSGGHFKWLREATGVGDDVDKLCQDLWGNRDEVARRQQPGKGTPRSGARHAP